MTRHIVRAIILCRLELYSYMVFPDRNVLRTLERGL